MTLRPLVLVFLSADASAALWGADPAAAGLPVEEDAPRQVGPVPESVRRELGLSPFYKKHVSAGGLPVVSSEKPSDFALLEAAYLVDRMLAHREDVRAAMIRNKARVAVMAFTEFTTDIPEHSRMKPKEYADKRARGMGGPACVSCAEENLLSYPGDPYATENILIHEFAHGIHQMGLRSADPAFNGRLRDAYREAMAASLWSGKYAASNPGEYWAEGVQSWFDTNRENDASHNHINTREELKEYDPGLARLVQEVFGDRPWRYRRPAERAEPAHLKGLDHSKAPRFSWPRELLEWNRLHAAEVERSRRGREDLTVSPIAGEAPPPSRESDKETSIRFINRLGRDVDLYWVGPDGLRRAFGQLAAGESVDHRTFAGHVWLVTDGDERPLFTVAAGERPGRAVIQAAPAPERPRTRAF